MNAASLTGYTCIRSWRKAGCVNSCRCRSEAETAFGQPLKQTATQKKRNSSISDNHLTEIGSTQDMKYNLVFCIYTQNLFPGKVATVSNYINYSVILDNLCSKLIIAGKENCFSSLLYLPKLPPFTGGIILLACFASVVTLHSSPKVNF